MRCGRLDGAEPKCLHLGSVPGIASTARRRYNAYRMDETQDTLKIGLPRKDEATTVTADDTPPEAPRASGNAAWIVMTVVIAVLVATGAGFAWQRMRGAALAVTQPVAPSASPTAVAAAPSEPAAPPQQRVLLVEDLVCKQPVDPTRAQWIAEFGDKPIYFCSEACLTEFRSNPGKYARITVRVKLSDRDLDRPLPPGEPPEPPAAPAAGADTLDNTENGPVGDSPLSLPPEPPPAAEPGPKTENLQDAPAVDEDNPPSDVPTTVPRDAPTMGAKKPAPDAAPADAPMPGGPEDLPSTVEPGTPGDNGFALPPDMGEPKPTRKPAPGKAKPAAKPGGDEPPSANEDLPQ